MSQVRRLHRGATTHREGTRVAHIQLVQPTTSPEEPMQKNGTMDTKLDSLKSNMRHFVEAGGERAGHVKDAVVKTGGKALKASGNFIKDHPFISIGIGFGVGYLVVRMLKK
jgi:ElaB/YqjD/DUF883 family membrane-anchored ribosome-binding protein